jgi:hypothetical protein
MQTGLFDLEFRLDRIDANGNPLKKIGTLIDWESFRSTLEAARDKDKERKSAAALGCPGWLKKPKIRGE